jgi:hypothetical protein
VDGGRSQKASLNATIKNICDAGMCVATERPLKKGCMVTFRGNKEDKTGIVRWQETDNGDHKTFLTGIQFVQNEPPIK